MTFRPGSVLSRPFVHEILSAIGSTTPRKFESSGSTRMMRMRWWNRIQFYCYPRLSEIPRSFRNCEYSSGSSTVSQTTISSISVTNPSGTALPRCEAFQSSESKSGGQAEPCITPRLISLKCSWGPMTEDRDLRASETLKAAAKPALACLPRIATSCPHLCDLQLPSFGVTWSNSLDSTTVSPHTYIHLPPQSRLSMVSPTSIPDTVNFLRRPT